MNEIPDRLMPDLARSVGLREDFANENHLEVGRGGHVELRWWGRGGGGGGGGRRRGEEEESEVVGDGGVSWESGDDGIGKLGQK